MNHAWPARVQAIARQTYTRLVPVLTVVLADVRLPPRLLLGVLANVATTAALLALVLLFLA